MRSDPEPVLRLEHATLGYSGRRVLEDVAVEVARGEFWFLVGPNGSGKTTLLRSLLGLLEPLAGHVWRHPVHAARARIGFVPQHCSLSPSLPTTVREFVSLGAIDGDRPRGALTDDLAWALERAGLAGLASRSYWSLSGGQRQRALVARALVRRPSVVLLDEPTEGMDVGSQDEFMETLARLHEEEGSSLLFVTHRIDLAARHATHVAMIVDSGVTAGPADSMLTAERLSAAFGSYDASRLAPLLQDRRVGP